MAPAKRTHQVTVGIDIGGTKIAGGLVDHKGHLLNREAIPTLADKGKKTSLGQVFQLLERLVKAAGGAKNVNGIGICAPGPLNPKTGVIIITPNLPGWVDVPLGQLVQKRFGVPTIVDNDANAAGLAEVLFGAAAGLRDIVYVTISTGIGTGIIIDGKIYHGKNGNAGEAGHVVIDVNSPYLCGCGARGCIEALASGPGIARRARVRLEQASEPPSLLRTMVDGDLSKITARTVADAARRKDPIARAILDETGFYLGVWLGGMVSIFDPEAIVIGGGVARIGAPLFDKIRSTIPEYTINRMFVPDLPIVPAKLKTDVGVYGAAALFRMLV
jgi:glucokinase